MKKHISITLHAILIFEKDENIHAHDTVLLNAAPRKGTQLCSYRPKQKQTKLSMLVFMPSKLEIVKIIKSRLKAIWLICKWCYMNQTNIAFRYIRILWICDLVFQRALLYHKMNLFYSKYFTLFLCKGHKNHLNTK